MRVLVVSAHYPPNFISGGTLGPQRVARGLLARGAEVSVYAGWLGDREPLDTWTDTDEEGIAVRWIAVTPWIDWSSERNFDNPDVETDFRLHLAEVRPDVVHVHSLQTLGVGIVRACVDSGVRVVVTMHDFWWICGRQFLSNRALRPCCAVVECGMCRCQVDRRWLNERTRDLHDALRGLDEVLAVSETAARVLRANGIGIDPDGPPLIVDENGLPALPGIGRRRLDGGDVVFLYTGGGDPMKGVHVLLEAARRMAPGRPWRIQVYGIQSYLDDFAAVLPPNVDLLPRFAPEDAGAVFDGADVLLLPSVVRESHSLVTREALARGMPVITTDTFGPEEVVVDRVNGLVVPAGDPAALAEAMTRVVEDGDLRQTIADGARSGVAVRDLEEQLDALYARFTRLASGPPRSRANRPVPARRIERVLFLVGIEGAPLRYRARFAAEALALHGVTSWVRHYRSPEAAALAGLADAVVVYRVPATRQLLALVESTRAQGIAVFFDVDDLVFDPEVTATIPAVLALPPDERRLYDEGVKRYRTTLEACDAFIGATEMLVDHVRDVVGLESHRWWNGVGIGPARCSDTALAHPRTPGPLRVGYLSGTKTHDHDWQYVEPAIVDVLEARPDCELWLGGLVTPTDALAPFRDRVKRLPMKPWWELPWVLRDLDVNLAPLEPGSVFNEAKSAIKWLEAALTETVTVATSTGPFRECIDSERNGVLAESAEGFRTAILELLDDDLLRVRMGRVARRDALFRWSPHLQGRRYLDILESAALGRRAPSTWESRIALDEPWLDVRLEDYIAPDPMILAPVEADFAGEPPPSGAPPQQHVLTRTASRFARELASVRRSVGSVRTERRAR